MNIFVAKLNFDTRESTLQAAFEAHGSVDSVKIIMDKMTGKSKGFGFVEMSDGAEGAIAALNDTDIEGRKLVVNESKPREDSR